MTKEDALELHFPNAAVERKTVFLTEQQVQAIQQRAKAKVHSKIITYYVARRSGDIQGYAFFDTHIVRTMPETFVVVVGPDSTVKALQILAFHEPEDYLPPQRWLTQFIRKVLDGDLWLKRGIQHISGATLSAQAITNEVRRLLAAFEIAIPKEH
jgi:hypothetical protein